MIVADAGPIISLARAGLLEILPILIGQIALPPAAFSEITRESSKPGALEIRDAAWVTVEQVPAEAETLLLSRNLGPGEREAIRLAHAKGAVRLLDEHRARREAARLGIPLTSTLALLEEAQRRSLIPSLGQALDRLQNSAFRLSARLREEVLHRSREGQPTQSLLKADPTSHLRSSRPAPLVRYGRGVL